MIKNTKKDKNRFVKKSSNKILYGIIFYSMKKQCLVKNLKSIRYELNF